MESHAVRGGSPLAERAGPSVDRLTDFDNVFVPRESRAASVSSRPSSRSSGDGSVCSLCRGGKIFRYGPRLMRRELVLRMVMQLHYPSASVEGSSVSVLESALPQEEREDVSSLRKYILCGLRQQERARYLCPFCCKSEPEVLLLEDRKPAFEAISGCEAEAEACKMQLGRLTEIDLETIAPQMTRPLFVKVESSEASPPSSLNPKLTSSSSEESLQGQPAEWPAAFNKEDFSREKRSVIAALIRAGCCLPTAVAAVAEHFKRKELDRQGASSSSSSSSSSASSSVGPSAACTSSSSNARQEKQEVEACLSIAEDIETREIGRLMVDLGTLRARESHEKQRSGERTALYTQVRQSGAALWDAFLPECEFFARANRDLLSSFLEENSDLGSPYVSSPSAKKRRCSANSPLKLGRRLLLEFLELRAVALKSYEATAPSFFLVADGQCFRLLAALGRDFWRDPFDLLLVAKAAGATARIKNISVEASSEDSSRQRRVEKKRVGPALAAFMKRSKALSALSETAHGTEIPLSGEERHDLKCLCDLASSKRTFDSPQFALRLFYSFVFDLTEVSVSSSFSVFSLSLLEESVSLVFVSDFEGVQCIWPCVFQKLQEALFFSNAGSLAAPECFVRSRREQLLVLLTWRRISAFANLFARRLKTALEKLRSGVDESVFIRPRPRQWPSKLQIRVCESLAEEALKAANCAVEELGISVVSSNSNLTSDLNSEKLVGESASRVFSATASRAQSQFQSSFNDEFIEISSDEEDAEGESKASPSRRSKESSSSSGSDSDCVCLGEVSSSPSTSSSRGRPSVSYGRELKRSSASRRCVSSSFSSFCSAKSPPTTTASRTSLVQSFAGSRFSSQLQDRLREAVEASSFLELTGATAETPELEDKKGLKWRSFEVNLPLLCEEETRWCIPEEEAASAQTAVQLLWMVLMGNSLECFSKQSRLKAFDRSTRLAEGVDRVSGSDGAKRGRWKSGFLVTALLEKRFCLCVQKVQAFQQSLWMQGGLWLPLDAFLSQDNSSTRWSRRLYEGRRCLASLFRLLQTEFLADSKVWWRRIFAEALGQSETSIDAARDVPAFVLESFTSKGAKPVEPILL